MEVTNELINEFRDFIKEHIPFIKFMDSAYCGFTFREHLKNASSKDNIVSDVVDWEYTVEGYDFWENIDRMWRKYLSNKQ